MKRDCCGCDGLFFEIKRAVIDLCSL